MDKLLLSKFFALFRDLGRALTPVRQSTIGGPVVPDEMKQLKIETVKIRAIPAAIIFGVS